MSLPSFPANPGSGSSPAPSPPSGSPVLVNLPSAGAGDHLPVWLLALCGAFTAVATVVSVMSIALQLKNYRKPVLQRFVVRIMVMVPLYAISSLIALFSLNAAFFIDAVRDLYEAFVIYAFLQLLITYLGGERSLLITLHGRPPIPHPFPISLFLNPMDPSDPWTLLNLKRGVLQYVQIKPILVLATIILKATGTFHEGDFASSSGYTYISVVYNVSICLSLYCLAMFWVAVNHDLKPFRPVPKFLCVKGILFFCFWQSVFISLLVAIGAIRQVGPYTDAEHMSLALVDSLICFEMPIFAIAHQYAFQASDYIDHSIVYAARLPFIYALRDAFGIKDVWEDTKDTIRGRGISYQAYEPAEGGLHYGVGRQRRIRAGLRYAKGGKTKYWIPIPGDPARSRGETGPISSIKRKVDARLAAREGYAPLLPEQAAHVVHHETNGYHNGYGVYDDEGGSRGRSRSGSGDVNGGIYVPADSNSEDSDAASLGFESVGQDEEAMYERARRIGYAGFPNVDVSREAARRKRWEEEEAILTGRPRSGVKGKGKGGKVEGKESKGRMGVYGAWADSVSPIDGGGGDDDDSEDGQGQDPARLARPVPPRMGKRRSSRSPAVGVGGGSKGDKVSRSPFTLGDEDEDLDADDERERGGGGASNGAGPSQQSGDGANGGGEGGGVGPSRPDAKRKGSDRPQLPSDAVDLVVEDPQAVERARERERRKGEPQTNAPANVYRHLAAPRPGAGGRSGSGSGAGDGGGEGRVGDGSRAGVRSYAGQVVERVYSPTPEARARAAKEVEDGHSGVRREGKGEGKDDGFRVEVGVEVEGGREGVDEFVRGEGGGGPVRNVTPPVHFGTSHEENPWA